MEHDIKLAPEWIRIIMREALKKDKIPSPELMKAWKLDYNKMLEQMIYEEKAPNIEEIISNLINLKNKINGLEWKFDKEFPVLKS